MTENQMIRDEPEAVYFRRELDVASNSGLKILDGQSAAHYLHWCEHPEEDSETAALAFGHGFHCATLEPDRFDSAYCVLPDDAPARPTAAMLGAAKPSLSSLERQAWWQNWAITSGGRQILPATDYDLIRGMADRQRSQVIEFPGDVSLTGGELFDLCEKEVTLRWVDARTGIRCKARVDLHCAEFRFGGDLKSTIDASPEGFARAVHRYRYHQQNAHYDAGADATGTPWDLFLFFASEKTKPFEPGVYHLPMMAIERGHELRNRALDTLKRCLDSGTWPGYTPRVTELNLPAFAYYDAVPSGA